MNKTINIRVLAEYVMSTVEEKMLVMGDVSLLHPILKLFNTGGYTISDLTKTDFLLTMHVDATIPDELYNMLVEPRLFVYDTDLSYTMFSRHKQKIDRINEYIKSSFISLQFDRRHTRPDIYDDKKYGLISINTALCNVCTEYSNYVDVGETGIVAWNEQHALVLKDTNVEEACRLSIYICAPLSINMYGVKTLDIDNLRDIKFQLQPADSDDAIYIDTSHKY